MVNPLNAELNPICHLLALEGIHHFVDVSRIRVKEGSFLGVKRPGHEVSYSSPSRGTLLLLLYCFQGMGWDSFTCTLTFTGISAITSPISNKCKIRNSRSSVEG
jgi:hypothetical protein